MKILALVPFIPWPLDRGDRMRAWELLRQLARQGLLTVALLTSETLTPTARSALESLHCSVQVHNVGSLAWNALVGIARGLPPALGAYWNPRLVDPIVDDVGSPWDLAVAFQLRAAPYALAVQASSRAIDFTDSLSMFRRRLPRTGRAAILRASLTGVHRVEGAMPSRFDTSWVSATDDAEEIARLSGFRPMVIPNGCDAVAQPAPYRADGPLLFMGNMRYPANADGIRTFVAQAWPIIRARLPNCRLQIVGQPTAQVVRTSVQPGVELLGALPDVRGHINDACAIINPVRYGSGSSLKVLAGWAAGRPVITTRAGARGLDFVEGKEILIADNGSEWVSNVAWLKEHPQAAAELGRCGWLKARSAHNARTAWAAALTPLVARGAVASLQTAVTGISPPITYP